MNRTALTWDYECRRKKDKIKDNDVDEEGPVEEKVII